MHPVRKRIRTWEPVKGGSPILNAGDGQNAPCENPHIDSDRVGSRADLNIVLRGILETMHKVANSDLRVLMVLAKLSCQQGNPVMVDQTGLAKLAGIQRSTVADSTRRLQDIGVISINCKRGGRSNAYAVNHAALIRAARAPLATPCMNGGAQSAA